MTANRLAWFGAALLAIAALAAAIVIVMLPNDDSGDQASEPLASAAPESSGGGQYDSFTLHGHWVIQVQDPDGSTVDRREFDNAFVGATTVAWLLRRNYSAGTWLIALGPIGTCGPGLSCWITEPGSTYEEAGVNASRTLTVGGTGGDVALTGSMVMPLDTSIAHASTFIGICDRNTAPAECDTVGLGPVTSRVLSPIAVVAGQQVLVDVTLTVGP